jgi:hypothetical protein
MDNFRDITITVLHQQTLIVTAKTNARVAGITFILYIAVGMTSIYLSTQLINGAVETADKLVAAEQNNTLAQINIILTLVSAACAIILAVTIYGLTRDVDRDIALMALCWRVAEGVIIVMATMLLIALMAIASIVTKGETADGQSFIALAELLFQIEGSTGLLAALCFAIGSTLYCYLFVRSRSIAPWLAWLGLISSIILVPLLPLRIAGLIEGRIATLMWLPMLLFELIFSFWLITKGVKQSGSIA